MAVIKRKANGITMKGKGMKPAPRLSGGCFNRSVNGPPSGQSRDSVTYNGINTAYKKMPMMKILLMRGC